MADDPPISLSISPGLLGSINKAAAWRHMSLQEYAVSVLETASRMDLELADFVQEGIDSADRGELISQAEMEAWFEARHRSAAAE